jgi:hypothetical protein
MVEIEANMSSSEGFFWAAAGFVDLIIGLFIFVTSPWGIVLSFIGLAAFAVGYYRHNPFKGMTHTHWGIAVTAVVSFIMVMALAVLLLLRFNIGS